MTLMDHGYIYYLSNLLILPWRVGNSRSTFSQIINCKKLCNRVNTTIYMTNTTVSLTQMIFVQAINYHATIMTKSKTKLANKMIIYNDER